MVKAVSATGEIVVDGRRRSLCLGILALAAIAAAPEVRARRRSGLRRLRSGVGHQGRVLTRDQLRQCVAELKAIDALEIELNQLQVSIAQIEESIKHLEVQINAREPFVNLYSQESVDSFNVLIDRHQTLVVAHNTKLSSANARTAQVNEAVDRFNGSCANDVYYNESDMKAVRAGK